MKHPLTIFVPHCSDLLTDHKPHGDGLIAYGFISRLAERGHTLHISAEKVEVEGRLPDTMHLYLSRREGDRASGRIAHSVTARRLFNALKKTVGFDIVHQFNPVFTGVSLAMLGCGLPVVLGSFITRWPDSAGFNQVQDSLDSTIARSIRTTLAGLQQRAAECIILTTPAAVDRLPHPGRVSDRTVYLPYGIDTDQFSPGPEPSEIKHPSAHVRILFLANVVHRKGILDLLNAFELVHERYPRAELIIAGSGSDFNEISQKAACSDGSGRIRFLGQQSRAQAVATFRSADIYCLPSHGEPYGMTAVEAMSCAKPLVVTDAGGLGFLVDEQGGIKVPVRSPERLAAALCELIGDPERRKRMGEYNRRKVMDTMAWDRVIDRLEEIYYSTIERHQQSKNAHFRSRNPATSKENCV